MSEQQERVEISWVQVAASALAALTSAVLLSTVGVAGTMIGAALGSVVLTVGNALYAHYLSLSRERVARAQAVALERVGRARISVSGAATDVRNGHATDTRTQARAQREVQQADEELEQAEQELQGAEAAPESTSWREVLTGLPWKRISALAAGVFVLAMLVILTFELITGRAVSQMTGGTSDDHARTSVPGIGLAASSTKPTPTPSETPSSEESTAEPSSQATPSESATPDASESSSPSASPESEPTTATPTTGAPTEIPSDVPTPTTGDTPAD